MPAKYYITGQEIILDNPYGGQPITFKNKRSNKEIIFSEKIVFERQTNHVQIFIGKFNINLDETGNILQVNKGTRTLFTIQE